MGAGQFAQGASDSPGEKRARGVGEDHSRACDLDGGSGTEQESGADGSSDCNHGHLPGAELMTQAVFLRRDFFWRHLGTLTEIG